MVDGAQANGATTANLTLFNIAETDRGVYQAKIQNPLGQIQSALVNLVASVPNRVVFVEPMVVNPGATVPVIVSLAAQGGERSARFSISFDPSNLLNPSLSLSPALPSGSTLDLDLSQEIVGWIGVRVTLPLGKELAVGKHPLVQALFQVAPEVQDAERIRICFEDQPLARLVETSDGTSLKTSYACGSLIVQVRDTLAVRLLGDGSVELTLTGAAGSSYEFQQSSDLLNWTLFTREQNVTGTLTVTDDKTSGIQQRFYRTLRQP